MTPATCVLVLAATAPAGCAGYGAAALVGLITRAPRLRYVAYSAAMAMALVPFLSGVIGVGAPGAAPIGLSGITPAALLRWTSVAPAHDGMRVLEQGAPGLLFIYALGAVACLCRLVLRWAALRRVLRKASPVDPEVLRGCRSVLPVRVTDGVRSALLIGVRRPVVVLPAQALTQMTPSQLRWVLAHEEAHARRGDNLRLLAEEALRAALWFNPFVAAAATRAAEAREQLCDQEVLRSADAAKRRAYAETLLLAFRLGVQSQVASALINPGRRKLVVRFNTILNPAKPTPTKAAATMGLVAAASLLACVVGAAAWAQTPQTFLKPTDGPADVKADRVMTSGCETIWSGNVVMQLGRRSLKADLLRITAAAGPKTCGRLLTGVAYGNVIHEDQGKVERGQVAHLDFTTGGIALK